MSLLETKSLSIGYPGKTGKQDLVLQKGIDVNIEPGQIISLMGQNGVGKTTFVKTLSGLLEPIEGHVFYGEKNLKNISKKELARRLSLVLTEKPFSFNISVLELIALGRHPYSNWMGVLSKHDKDIIEWAFEETHTNYLANKKLFELSDGQLQKVMIARALAQETDLIILDEPTAHLDLHNKIEVMTLLRQISSTGKGILISTHDLQICTQLSDRLWLFNFQESVKEGIPEDLILDGTLEKTLYLQDYGYDMIHGSISLTQNGPKISVKGAGDKKYWTEQALKREGFQISNEAAFEIEIKESIWRVKTGGKTEECNSIEELLGRMKTLEKAKPR